MSSGSQDFEDLESTVLKPGEDAYAVSIKDKQNRRMYVSNFLESKEQSQMSAMGGQMFANKVEGAPSEDRSNTVMKQFLRNIKNVMVPVFVTAMAGTITYPIAVRVARSKYLFKLRSFYAIHLAIAPFLAFAHLNIFFTVHTYLRIKTMESDYREFLLINPSHTRDTSQEDYSLTYDRIKRQIIEKDYSLDVQRDI